MSLVIALGCLFTVLLVILGLVIALMRRERDMERFAPLVNRLIAEHQVDMQTRATLQAMRRAARTRIEQTEER